MFHYRNLFYLFQPPKKVDKLRKQTDSLRPTPYFSPLRLLQRQSPLVLTTAGSSVVSYCA